VSVTGFKFEEFELYPHRCELRRSGQPVKLENIPLNLLTLLVEKKGGLVSRQEIVERLWGADVFLDTEHGINTAIRKIRRILDDDPEEPRFVRTVTGRGYCFMAELTAIEELTSSGNGNQAGSLPIELAPPGPVPRSKSRIANVIAASFIVVVVLTAAWFFRPAFPPPRIIRTDQLTSDGAQKFPNIGTDGIRIYFTEWADQHWRVAAVPVTGGAVVPIHAPFRDFYFISVSPDKSELLVGVEGALWFLPLVGGSPHRLADIVAHSARWSADGQRLAYVKGGVLSVANADGTNPRQLYADSGSDVWAWTPTWSRDGSSLRFELFNMVKKNSTLWEIDANGKNLHPVLPGWQATPMQCCSAWTLDGNYYLFDAWNEMTGGSPITPVANLWAIREKSGFLHKTNRLPMQITAGPVHFFTHVLSPDGKVIFALSTEQSVEFMRYDARSKRPSPYLPGFSADYLTFSPDGNWVAYVKYPQGELWRSKADSTESLQLSFSPMVASEPRWSPDGKSLVFDAQIAGNSSKPYTVSVDGGPIKPLLPESMGGTEATWSPDGNSVLVGQPQETPNQDLRIFDIRTRQVSVVPGSRGLFSSRWSPNGQYITALTSDREKLMLFDFKTKKWRMPSQMTSGWPEWSHDGRYVYFVGSDSKPGIFRGSVANDKSEPGIFRVSIANDKVEKIIDLRNVRTADVWGVGFSLTPEDEPLVLQEAGSGMEIYALHWETP